MTTRLDIAIFDYLICSTNPAGSCHLKLIEELSDKHSFTVFAARFDGEAVEGVRYVHVPVLRSPLFMLFLSYHVMAFILYGWEILLRRGRRFDVVQSVESNFLLPNVVYAHFCHQMFLRCHWQSSKGRGLRMWARWLDHALHALLEPRIFRRASTIVVPSRGLASEIAALHPDAAAKLVVIPNAVDIHSLQRPSDEAQARSLRRSLGIPEDCILLSFIALGQFERKGLPILLEAMALLRNPRLKLLVVGGTPGLVKQYATRVTHLGLQEQVYLLGMVKDVRPALWSSDAFVLLSAYEVFPLVALQAAAAGLPLLVTRLNGIEEFFKPGEMGELVDRTHQSVADGLRILTDYSLERRRFASQNVFAAAQLFSHSRFVDEWRRCYEALATR